MNFSQVLSSVRLYAALLGFNLIDSSHMEKFYKGDLNGREIWLAERMEDEEELFNLLHLMGHSIQWNTEESLRTLGSVLHYKPDEETLKRLQEYEWEANCYGLQILYDLRYEEFEQWLNSQYKTDMVYLTHYYMTGEKTKNIPIPKNANYIKPLVRKIIPHFYPVANEESRNGIVIDFA